MFYVTSQFLFKISKREKEAWSEYERVSLKVVVRTQSGIVDYCGESGFLVGKGRQHNDAVASRAGKANGAYWRRFCN